MKIVKFIAKFMTHNSRMRKNDMKKQKIQIDNLQKVLKYIKEYRILLLISLVLAATTVALTLYVPILIGRAIDCIVGPNDVDFVKIAEILIKICLTVAITAVFQWLMNQINNKITYHVVQDVRIRAFRKSES